MTCDKCDKATLVDDDPIVGSDLYKDNYYFCKSLKGKDLYPVYEKHTGEFVNMYNDNIKTFCPRRHE